MLRDIAWAKCGRSRTKKRTEYATGGSSLSVYSLPISIDESLKAPGGAPPSTCFEITEIFHNQYRSHLWFVALPRPPAAAFNSGGGCEMSMPFHLRLLCRGLYNPIPPVRHRPSYDRCLSI